jgi:hypothetical protein
VLGFASKHLERVSALIMPDTTGGYTNPEIDRLRAANKNPRSAFAPGYGERDPAMVTSVTTKTPVRPSKEPIAVSNCQTGQGLHRPGELRCAFYGT